MIIKRDFFHTSVSSVTVGVFDGVHLGHQAVLSKLVKPSCVVTFRKNPKAILGYQRITKSIMPFKLFYETLKSFSVTFLLILNFRKVRFWSAEFFLNMIFKFLQPARIILGETARLGNDKLMIPELRKKLGHGVVIEAVSSVCLDGEKISSTKLRSAVTSGDIDAYFCMTGRQLTTLAKRCSDKLVFKDHLLPTDGIFRTDRGIIEFDSGMVKHDNLNVGTSAFVPVRFLERVHTPRVYMSQSHG